MSTWVTSDLHGNYELWDKIKKFLKADDKLIFLGDAIDRGSRGFEIFKELLEHPQVTYIRGNHEQMMYDAFTSTGPASTQYFKHWMSNGGQATLDDAKVLGLRAEKNKELINSINQLPFYAEYKSKTNKIKFIFCHAGYAPGEYFDQLEDYQKQYKMLWDRSHWNSPWPADSKYDNVVLVHGHTPIPIMNMLPRSASPFDLAPYWYENNHKVNLDAATTNTGMALLFNADTLNYKVFLAEPELQ